MIKDVSLYFHIPFCKTKCAYCDFDSEVTSEIYQNDYIDSIIKEIDISYNKYNLENRIVKTIYIGGGTPTSLSYKNLEKILSKIQKKFDLREAEFSIETNPNSIDEKKVSILKKYGVNRVSIGLQSANENELKILRRSHSFMDFDRCINLFKKYKFQNINVDIMFGIPNQTIESFEKTIEKVLKQDVNHISCYGLILEEGTLFYDLYKKGILNFSNDEVYIKMYEHLTYLLEKNEIYKYEISNFAKKGYECLHNIRYWKNNDYIGFGRSAHSFINKTRFFNKKDNYIKSINNNILPIDDEVEFVDKKSLFDEWIMLRLRMTEGINIEEINKEFKINFMEKYKDIIQKNIENKYMEFDNKNIFLTTRGFEISNKIILDIVSLE